MISPGVRGNPYPPYWTSGTGSNIHFDPATWPADADWTPYTHGGYDDEDPRTLDPSNGGTRPQNYVNVSSGCTDQSLPSIYYYYDTTTQTIFFRWRVEQIANTYGMGPNPGSFSSGDPWNSALWTVFFDIDGDGFREFAVHLDGSTGSPGEEIDRVMGIYANTPSMSIDYIGDADIHLLAHNPTAFVDGDEPAGGASDYILNFQNSGTPVAGWPSGSAETVWDYGTTRSVKILDSPYNEYFVDYQIPLGLLDASAVGGPTMTETTPFAMFFATANSLNNPVQKDAVVIGTEAFLSDPSREMPFGDYITLKDGTLEQPIITVDAMSGCGPAILASHVVKDSLYVASKESVLPTITKVDYYYYFDVNGDGRPNDIWDGSDVKWTFATSATRDDVSRWSGSWVTPPGLPMGQYLIGVRAEDNITKNIDGNTHVTWSFFSAAEIAGGPPTAWPDPGRSEDVWPAPANTEYFANPEPDPGVAYSTFLNNCGYYPEIVKSVVGSPQTTIGGTIDFTLEITNPAENPDDLILNSITDVLPPYFSFDGTSSVTTSPAGLTFSSAPSNGDGGTITWVLTTPETIVPGGTVSPTFTANAPTGLDQTGTYTNNARANADYFGDFFSDPVQVGVGSPRLTISKTWSLTNDVDTDGVVDPGDELTYTITYSNDSPVNVTSVYRIESHGQYGIHRFQRNPGNQR